MVLKYTVKIVSVPVSMHCCAMLFVLFGFAFAVKPAHASDVLHHAAAAFSVAFAVRSIGPTLRAPGLQHRPSIVTLAHGLAFGSCAHAVKPVYSQLSSAAAHSQSRPGRAPDNCNDCTEALPSRSPVRVPLVDWLPGGPLHYYQPRFDWYQYQQVAVAARGRAGGTSAWPSVAWLFRGEQAGEQPSR